MISHDIQKDIVAGCKIETIKVIIKDLDGDYFSLLVDESRYISHKDQMVICLRYVDKKGFVKEAFIGLVHVKDTSALSLKKAIVDVLANHSLTLALVREQCYDVESNMKDFLNPIDSFSSFDIKRILVMHKLYPDNFDEFKMRALENQLVNYIIDVRDIDKRFSSLGRLEIFVRKLVETKKHLSYPFVFLLVKFALLLAVAITSVERTFLSMKYIKNDFRN
ncbi:uncharacterized protein LOC107851250 [Capsicum annuum]|uniref:uncharacterized protein LOC107851250 n=1 Tax=Capsicum annuum TaxID=4072 RepID=UPI001FB16261|nr:uncharacterized protein LOC107851250 [Capsicum annuum]